MQITYPNFLLDTPAEDVRSMKRLWHAELQRFSSKQVSEAASRMSRQHQTFAPTIGEFLSLLDSVSNNKQPKMGLDLCNTCRSYVVTQRHQDMCVNGLTVDPVFTNEQIKKTKEFVNALRSKR